MTTVGVRDLKARLSQHLKSVQRGRTLTVTDRGRAVAVLSPVEGPTRVAWAMRMVQDGVALWSDGKPSGLSPRIQAKGHPASRHRRPAMTLYLDTSSLVKLYVDELDSNSTSVI